MLLQCQRLNSFHIVVGGQDGLWETVKRRGQGGDRLIVKFVGPLSPKYL